MNGEERLDYVLIPEWYCNIQEGRCKKDKDKWYNKFEKEIQDA